jgi:hypothetical protein
LALDDYTRDSVELQSALPNPPQRGAGDLPGLGSPPRLAPSNQQWARCPAGDFIWRTPARADQPLRQAIAPTSPAHNAVAHALTAAGYLGDIAELALRNATSDLDRLSDEELFLAWLTADRAVLAQSEDLARAAREGLLLLARDTPGPAIVFTVGKQNVYLLPIADNSAGSPPSDRTSTWLALESYQAGMLQWIGTVRLEGAPFPARARLLAARLAQETRTVPTGH